MDVASVSIFISYRRSDTDSAVLFYSWLQERFGPAQVFWDREDIPPGARWADVLKHRLRQSTALVALIGPDWLTMADEAGRRRLNDPQDWVRREIATALELKLLVVQVLMGGAKMLITGVAVTASTKHAKPWDGTWCASSRTRAGQATPARFGPASRR